VPQSEGRITIGRLDLLESAPGDRAVILEHRGLGQCEIPAGKLVTIWDLPQYVSEKGKTTLQKQVADALAGNAAAARQLELSLPLAHSFIREGLQSSPHAKGAPRLRMILALFDDVPTPPPADPQLTPYGPGGGRGRVIDR
jgi:hypothetical protein